MNKRKIIIANWKMNPLSTKEAEKIFNHTIKGIADIKKTEILVCPPFLYLEKLKKLSKKVSLGAQNVFWEEKGAYTGEVSVSMLVNSSIKYVILGHSERRAMGESNIDINKKIKASLSASLLPILCIGETERDENHEYFNTIKAQVEECLNGISKNLIPKIIIAYEPVWALSTTANRRDATSGDSSEMVIFIKKILSDKFGVKIDMPRIIYGGSINEKNVEEFLKNGNVEGVLVGGASLIPEKFIKIIKICEALNK